MRRTLAVLASVVVLLTTGCLGKSYEGRLEKTLDQRRYVKRLDDNLMPPPGDGKLKSLQVFVRPPKALAGPAKEFLLAPPEEGKFDVTESYVEPGKSAMHVLARVRQPKGAAGKKAPPTPTNRGDFNNDVLTLLGGVYNLELDPALAKEESKKNNKFKRLAFEGNGKNVQVFLSGSKTSTHEVALIFEYPKTEQSKIVPKIDLTLESFAIGPFAQRSYEGAVGDEVQDETAENAAGVAF